MDLILIRHGRPERSEATADPHLNPLGQEQAARVARWLSLKCVSKAAISLPVTKRQSASARGVAASARGLCAE